VRREGRGREGGREGGEERELKSEETEMMQKAKKKVLRETKKIHVHGIRVGCCFKRSTSSCQVPRQQLCMVDILYNGN
jgi:hypothetical protein